MKKFVLIVAGGSGSRMKQDIPKQFTNIGGQPVLMHTFNAFLKYDPNINFILVLPELQVKYWKELCLECKFTVKHKIAFGGETRFHSVKNGLELVPEQSIVFIHDGVRPLVSVKTIEACYQMAIETGNALPVVPVTESLRMIEADKNKAVDRSLFYRVQTPQTFSSTLIKKAYTQKYTSLFTDDASVLELAGYSINLVEGNRENIKITYPEELDIAEIWLRD